MAPPKKIIAPRNLANNQKQICLFYRIKQKWYLEKTLVEEIFNSNVEELKQLMRQLSEQLKIPWQKKGIRVKNKKKKVKSSSEKIFILYFDGSSYLHFQLGACAYVILSDNLTFDIGNQILNKVNSTEAEYMGLIMGLKKAVELGISKINIKGDSRTIINQLKGVNKIKKDSLTYKYYQQVLELLSLFEEYTLTWIPRRKNQRADRLAYKCIKHYFQQLEIN